MAPNGSMWRAKHTFWTEDSSGQVVRVDENDLLREGHEFIQNNPGAFEAYEPKMRFEDVEEATAEPIPRRRGRPPKNPDDMRSLANG
jgi:hypothetical protein